MLARDKMKRDVSAYVSDHVFDGVRPVSPARLAKLRANYHRTHTTWVFRLLGQITRLFSFATFHGRSR